MIWPNGKIQLRFSNRTDKSRWKLAWNIISMFLVGGGSICAGKISKSTRKNPYTVQKNILLDVIHQRNHFIMAVHSPMLRAKWTSKMAEVAAKLQSKKCDHLESRSIRGVQATKLAQETRTIKAER